MKKIVLVAIVGIVVSCQMFAEEGEADKPSVEVVGVQVVIKGFDYDEKWDRYQDLPFNTQGTGVELALALLYPKGGIIKFDDKKSVVKVLVDNRKSNLLEAPEGNNSFNKPGFGSFPKISEGADRVMFSIKSPVLPAKGATKLAASGTVALLTGSTKKTAEIKDVKLEVGSKIASGPFSYEITKVGKPSWGDAEMGFDLNIKRRPDEVIEYKFLDAAGNELKVETDGSSWFGMGSAIDFTQSFKAEKKIAEPVTIQINYWSDMKQVDVPFRVNTGLVPAADKKTE